MASGWAWPDSPRVAAIVGIAVSTANVVAIDEFAAAIVVATAARPGARAAPIAGLSPRMARTAGGNSRSGTVMGSRTFGSIAACPSGFTVIPSAVSALRTHRATRLPLPPHVHCPRPP